VNNALVLYWSHTGNTEKVAVAVQAGLEAAGLTVDRKRVQEAGDLDLFDYDLVCLGFPSYGWHPPRAVDDYLKARFALYRKQGRVVPGAPALRGRNALVFCTYSGPHTGSREAVPAGKYAGQFFEHLGFAVLDEWYVLSEFHGDEELSTIGRMGDIRGLPSEQDLARIESQARLLAQRHAR
jgi:hypothetical protein